MNLLHIDTSALGTRSISRTLTAAIVARFRQAVPDLQVRYLDLDTEPLPHLTGASLAGTDPAGGERAAQVLEDFLAADVVVIGVPMYNFSIPSTLKAWIDRITVAGKTFRYTADGPQGLAGPKRVILAVAQGGVHEAGGPSDFQESYLCFLFRFLGIDQVEVVRAQGVNLSPEAREQALQAALATLPEPPPLAQAA
jgi:FMN-dependent NADH-azoreductase